MVYPSSIEITNKEKVTLKRSKDLIEEAILKLATQIRVVYKKRNKVISCTVKL